MNTRRAQFTENSHIHDVLLDCGECRETRDTEGLIPRTPTAEAAPQCPFVISVGVVHKLRALVWSKEPMVRGGAMRFVFELDGAQCVINPGDGRVQNWWNSLFLPNYGRRAHHTRRRRTGGTSSLFPPK